jgi:hypothetical protein
MFCCHMTGKEPMRSLGAGSPGSLLGVLLARGPEEFASFSDSEECSGCGSEPPSPPPFGKGKAVAGPSRKRKRARRHRRRRGRAEGFMAAARRAYVSPPAHRASPPSHPPRPFGEPDSDGFFSVRSRRFDRRRSPPRRAKPVPPALVGLCFNCLASSHVKVACRFPLRCYNC